MLTSRFVRAFVAMVAIASLHVVTHGHAPVIQEQRAAQQTQSGGFEVVAKGIVASPPFEVHFTSVPLRLAFRNLIMGRGETEQIRFDTTVLMELRQGGVVTTINQQKTERASGDFWVVERSVPITIQNPGEVAVIRAVYIFEGNR
jgi:hypothetical protein